MKTFQHFRSKLKWVRAIRRYTKTGGDSEIVRLLTGIDLPGRLQIQAHLVLARVFQRNNKRTEALKNYQIVINNCRKLGASMSDPDVEYLIGYATIFYESCKINPDQRMELDLSTIRKLHGLGASDYITRLFPLPK